MYFYKDMPSSSSLIIASHCNWNNNLHPKDFNLRFASCTSCKKFKKQNVHHAVSPLYLKMQVHYVHHVQRIKVMLTDIVDVDVDISIINVSR